MDTTSNSQTITDVCTATARIVGIASLSIQQVAESGGDIPLEAAELFEQLANDLLDLTAMICAHNRLARSRSAAESPPSAKAVPAKDVA
ncbi:hypothetical protein [Aureimonas phyllosphaerae]|uniref:Uncharacterized protein n=1 Tax=Aureimonas phyllosphaerae TaxID=1166078 RepID=A0A7W6FWD5_9HYPH|nr:hypothetical protein [Aureimonas phyllosphaerae]MBB3938249.1 hypothetical protein [Aureimonas phyllosphaerae]MBB3962256.1 hypothetical protein [Aureimonas phyllosphaerae]SFF59803.1 hypothetical protein SAMN05216566_14415 [Aureimonas phyllosphaerae]